MLGVGVSIESFLAADGFQITSRAPGCVTAERPGDAGSLDCRTVWYAEPDAGIAVDQTKLIAAFRDHADSSRTNAVVRTMQGFFVVPALTGQLPCPISSAAICGGKARLER